MNDPEVIMFDALPNSTLIVHRKALEAAGIALALVVRVPAPLKTTPSLLLPEMRLPAPAALPPMVLTCALANCTPDSLLATANVPLVSVPM